MNGTAHQESFTSKEDGPVDVLSQWRDCASQQEGLIKALLAENKALKKLLEDTESDNFTMKTTIRVLRQDAEEVKSLTAALEAKITSAGQVALDLEAQRNLVLTLIDGDGYIFHPELLKKGEAGGREAAALLTQGINGYIANQPTHPPKPVLWTMIFLSKEKLEMVLSRTNSCSPEEFKLFIKGFSQSHGLFSFVEVGAHKEAADYKIREHLTEFVGNPRIYKILLGVDHDNGYGAALSTSLTAGHQSRLILLRAHKSIVSEIARLGLDTAHVEGLFLDEKLMITPPPPPRLTNSYATAAINRSPSISSTSSLTSPNSNKMYIAPGKRDSKPPKRDPRPCNHHYLRGYCSSQDTICQFGHDYILSEEELEQLAMGAQQQPCKYVNDGLECHLDDCIYGHKCPRGPTCSFRAIGKCKFKGKGMHDA